MRLILNVFFLKRCLYLYLKVVYQKKNVRNIFETSLQVTTSKHYCKFMKLVISNTKHCRYWSTNYSGADSSQSTMKRKTKTKNSKILVAAAPPLAPINNAGEKTPPNKPKPMQIAVIRILKTTSINKK